jgi:hypothetical protein
VGEPEGTVREPVNEPIRPEKVFRPWPVNDSNIDEKLKAIEEWVRHQTGEESNKKFKSRAEIEDLLIESSGLKRGADEDDEVLEIKIDGSPLEKDATNLWVNRPEKAGQFDIRIVDDNSRVNKPTTPYATSLDQVKRARAILDKNKKARPPYIRSSIVAIASNDAFRVLVLSDEEIYDKEVGLPPKYKVNRKGELVPAKRYTPEYKREKGYNASWDSLVLSHNEAIVVAARFNSYFVVLALIKLYLDRRAISKPNGKIPDDPRFLECDFDLFWGGSKALKVACQHGSYEVALILLNPLGQKIEVVSANKTKKYLSSPLNYKPIRNGKMWEGFTLEDAEECRSLLGIRERKSTESEYRQGLRQEVVKRLNRLRPIPKEVAEEPPEPRRSTRNKGRS